MQSCFLLYKRIIKYKIQNIEALFLISSVKKLVSCESYFLISRYVNVSDAEIYAFLIATKSHCKIRFLAVPSIRNTLVIVSVSIIC